MPFKSIPFRALPALAIAMLAFPVYVPRAAAQSTIEGVGPGTNVGTTPPPTTTPGTPGPPTIDEGEPDDDSQSNGPPVITVPGNQQYEQGETITPLDVTVTDPDGDPVTVSGSGLPAGLTIHATSATTGQVRGTVQAEPGTFTVTVEASDGVNPTQSASFTITIRAAVTIEGTEPDGDTYTNRPPVITVPGDQEYEQGETITPLDIAVSDPDGDELTVSGSGLPAGLTIHATSATTGQVRGTVRAGPGTYTVTVEARDWVSTTRAVFTITVRPAAANLPPAIAVPGAQEYEQGETITPLHIAVSDPDGDELTVSGSGLPAGLTIHATSATTGQVRGTVRAGPGTYTVTVEASDGVNTTRAVFTITVRPAAANLPPAIAVPGDQQYGQGETITPLHIGVSDPDGDELTVSGSGLPAGLTIHATSATTGQVRGTVRAEPGTYTVTVEASDGVNATRAVFTITVRAAAVNREEGGGVPQPGTAALAPPPEGPLQLALWTDRPGYRSGGRVRLYRTQDSHGERTRYLSFFYLEQVGSGERRYFAPGSRSQQLREQVVDHRGRPEGAFRAERVQEAERELIWEGAALEPGLWQFVAELREEGAEPETKRAYAKFVVADRGQVLNRRGFDREIAQDLTLRSDTIYFLGHQLFVRSGATLTIEPGTLVLAWGRSAAIVVEQGGRLVARGTREAPVVLTCSTPTGQREPGCWGGLRVLGRAPVTRQEGVAAGVLPPDRPLYGGSDPHDSSGVLQYVRVEFAGAGPRQGTATAALGLCGVGDGTVLQHVQAHASLGDGLAFAGGTAACHYCVASGSGAAGLAWERGWRGAARHLYVQHGRDGVDGITGGNDEQGHDLEPRSRPELSHVTLVHSRPYGQRARQGAGLRLGTGTAIVARDLLVTRFGGGAIATDGRAALLFDEGQSSVRDAILYRNGRPLLRGGIATGVEYRDVDPELRNLRWEANPDPRPESESPALRQSETEPAQYVGAFEEESWLEEWTFLGPEADYRVQD